MTRASGTRALAALLGIASCGACSGFGLRDAELPEAPIAIHYRTPDESRRRAEALLLDAEAHMRGERTPGRHGTAKRVVPHLDQLGSFFRGGPGPAAVPADHAGRLAFFHPRSGQVDVVDAARRGSIPLDWSNDRARLLFAQPEGDAFQLWELRVSDGRTHRVTAGPNAHLQGCYGPEERIVAVAAERVGEGVRSRIVRTQPGGRAPYEWLSDGPVDHSPTCAPAGGQVAWVAEARPGRPVVLVARPEPATPPRRVSAGRDPSFAPDSAWLVFSGPRGRGWGLWRSRNDTAGRVALGSGALDAFRPAVSPDGRFVAYVASEVVPKRHLYVRRFDGSGDRILLADGDAEHPVW